MCGENKETVENTPGHRTVPCLSKEFVINDTPKTIIFSQVVTGESLGQNISDNISNEISVTLYSKEHPDLKIPLNVFSENGKWYAKFRNNEVYPVSQEFVNLLKYKQNEET